MLAVHRSLVIYESAMLAGMGHEVCTMYDLVGTNGAPVNPHVIGAGDRLPDSHPCRKKPVSIDVKSMESLRLLNLSLSKESMCSLSPDSRVLAAILENFDAIYVQMVPAWLLAYGVPMLRAGKKAVLRVFGHPLQELGCAYTPIRELTDVSRDPNMTLMPVLKSEIGMWSWWKGRVCPVMAAVGAANPCVSPRSGFMSVLGGGEGDLCRAFRQQAAKSCVPYKNLSYEAGFLSDEAMAREFESAEFYIDCYASDTVIKYSSLEAIAHGTISLIGPLSGQSKEMAIDGFCPNSFWWDVASPGSAIRVGLSLDKNIAKKEQSNWLSKTQAAARDKWRSILEAK